MLPRLNSILPRPVGWLLYAALAGLAVHAVHTVFGVGPQGLLEDWLYPVVLGACAGTCVARGILGEGERMAWIGIGAGIGAWAAGDAYWSLRLTDVEVIQAPTLADALRLLMFPATCAGVVLLVRARVPAFRATLWLDGAIAALAVGAVGAVLLHPAIERAAQGSAAAVATGIAYPLGAMVLVGLVTAAGALTGWRAARGSVLVAGGLALNGITTGAILVSRDATGGALAHSPLDTLWLLSALLIALGAWDPATRAAALRRDSRRVLAIPSGFAAVALAVEVYNQLAPVNQLAAGLAIATLAAVIARMALMFADNQKLLAVTRRESHTDPVTGLGNRRRLLLDLQAAIEQEGTSYVLAIFDLDGFKDYNDSFGHPAGDALLGRLGENLAATMQPEGGVAYRLGGDEFGVLAPGGRRDADGVVAAASAALSEAGRAFSIGSSSGAALVPGEADEPSAALGLADRRMHGQKRLRAHSAERQTRNVLLRILKEREPDLDDHLRSVASLVVILAREVGIAGEELDVVARAGEMHDVGKIAIPEDVLRKDGPLSEVERQLVRTHTLIGERILASAPAMAPVARLVRSGHERWDGTGYPDRLAGEDIPLGARVIAICDAFDAMVSTKPYRRSMDSHEAVEELRRCAGTQFDPRLVDLFCEFVHPQVGDWAIERAARPAAGAVTAPARARE